jgi:hypothetical protein
MVPLAVGAGILGITIAVMEEGEFPGWGKMIGGGKRDYTRASSSTCHACNLRAHSTQ